MSKHVCADTRSETLHATLNGDTITGTAVETDRVVTSGTSDIVSTLIGNSSFTLTRQ